jgi:hypothetical protein
LEEKGIGGAVKVYWTQIDALCSNLGIRCVEYDYWYEAFDNSLGWLLAYIRNRYREVLESGLIVRGRANTSVEFDCDDYAILFKALAQNYGLSVGFALGYMEGAQSRQRYYHAFNILPLHTGQQLVFMLVEPQNIPSMQPFIYPMASSCVENVKFNYHAELFRYCAVSAEF